MNFFGRRKAKPQAPAPTPSSAPKSKAHATPQQGVEAIRKQVETLEKRDAFLQKKVSHQLAEAKMKSKKGDKKGAMFCLKRKKMFEKEIDKISGMRMNLEQQMMALEAASINADAFKAMESGSKAMQNIQQTINIEKVEDITDDIQENMQMADEISNAISQPMGDMYDDDDLLNELDDMEAAELDAELLGSESSPVATVPTAAVPNNTESVPALPTAPEAEIEDEDAAELAKLQAELAM